MTNEISTNSAKAWWLAARPKTLSAAAMPVLIGCAIALTADSFQWTPAILCLLFAFLMQIDANLINDLFDYKKGSDRQDRLGPERACAQGWITIPAMQRGILITTTAACLFGLGLLFYGGWELILVGLLCVLFAFLYTAGPYPLAYHGWGDLLVLLFFGFIPVGCTYYVMCHNWTFEVTIASLSCGMVIDTLLMVNNFRDREQDATSGKQTLVVRFGSYVGQQLYLWLGIVAVLLNLLMIGFGQLWAAILPLLYLPLHIHTWRSMVKIDHGKELNRILGLTSRNMLLYAILFTIGSMIVKFV